MSWLIAFNVINTYNDIVRSIWVALRADHRADLSPDPADHARFRRARSVAAGRAADHRHPVEDRHPEHRCLVTGPGRALTLAPSRASLYRRAMTASIIDGKGFAAALRERIAAQVAAFRAAAGRAPGWRWCWSARTRPPPSMSAPRARRPRARGWRASSTTCPPIRRRTICSRWSTRSTPIPRSTASSSSCRCPSISTSGP